MSHSAINQYRNTSSQAGSEWWKLLAAVGLTVAIVYFGHMRPADRNLLLLQRQCHELNLAVNQLTRQTVAADGTLGVIESLSVQNARIADAEAKLDAISQRWDAIAAEAERIATRTGEFAELAHAKSRLASHSQTLDQVLDAVDDLEIVRQDMKASQQQLNRVGATLANLDAMQGRLTRALERVERAAPALDAVDALCKEVAISETMLAGSQEKLAAATGKSYQQASILSNQLTAQANVLANSRRSLQQTVNKQADVLKASEQTLAASGEQIDALIGLQNQVIAKTADITDAEATLERLIDMQASVQLADATLSDIQHMVVDVMLIQPAAERAVAALKPVVEFTRMSRRLDPKIRFSSKPEPASEQEAQPTKVSSDEKASDENLDIATTILNWF